MTHVHKQCQREASWLVPQGWWTSWNISDIPLHPFVSYIHERGKCLMLPSTDRISWSHARLQDRSYDELAPTPPFCESGSGSLFFPVLVRKSQEDLGNRKLPKSDPNTSLSAETSSLFLTNYHSPRVFLCVESDWISGALGLWKLWNFRDAIGSRRFFFGRSPHFSRKSLRKTQIPEPEPLHILVGDVIGRQWLLNGSNILWGSNLIFKMSCEILEGFGPQQIVHFCVIKPGVCT